MKVLIKKFDVEMEVKNNGIEFEVRTPDGQSHVGDVVLKKSGLVWCKGRKDPKNGIRISWDEFIKFAEQNGS